MKLLLSHASADLYGSDRMAAIAAGAMTGKGHQVTVVLPVKGPLIRHLRDAQAHVVVADVPVLRRADLHPTAIFGLLRRLCRSLGPMFRILRSEDPDVVYVNTIVQPWWIVAGKIMRRRVVVHVREAEPQSALLVRRLLYGALRLADLVVCNSEATRAEITSLLSLPAERTSVIYNGKDWSLYRIDRRRRSLSGRAEPELLITVIGRLSQRKGQDIAIRALREVITCGRRARLTLVGDVFAGNETYRAELTALARELGVHEFVRFAGFQTDIRPVLADTDVAVVPSRVEPFGTVAAESMAAGVLTIVSEVQGLLEIVDPESNGLTFPSGDHRALAEKCCWAAEHPGQAAALAEEGRRSVIERFGLDRYQSQIIETLESVEMEEASRS
ncbi:glycosyltransferase family 4 protein [Mycolicibacterium vaccae]|uniref:glycosyltransferase family 4 protein n=1 Tax=Mycolicibacterium vaccae TaxID=1810 RepID=UPI003D0593FF